MQFGVYQTLLKLVRLLNSALCIGDLCHTPYVDLTTHKMQFGVYQTLLKLVRPLNSALCIGDLCHTLYVDITTHKLQFGLYQTLLKLVCPLKSINPWANPGVCDHFCHIHLPPHTDEKSMPPSPENETLVWFAIP